MEDLQSKVERLEFYIGLLRNIAASPDEFSFLDWVIANNLSEDKYEQLMEVLKKANRSLMNSKEGSFENTMTFQELSNQITNIIKVENEQLNKKRVEHVIRNAAKLPGFHLLNHYIQQLQS